MKIISKYILIFILFAASGLFLLDGILLPLLTNTNEEIYLPDVRHSSIYKAEKQLNDLGFNVEVIISNYNEIYTPNTVISMSPRAFTKIKKGRSVKLTIAGDKKNIIINDFVNTSLTSAQLIINQQGLKLDTIIYEYNNDYKKDLITSQYPKPGKVLQTNDKITYIVSLGDPPNYYVVPTLININYSKAKEIISKSGLRIGNIKYEYNDEYLNNTILEQSITGGLKLSFPKSIDLIISTDIR